MTSAAQCRVIAVAEHLDTGDATDVQALMASAVEAGIAGIKLTACSPEDYATRDLLAKMDRWWNTGTTFGHSLGRFTMSPETLFELARVENRPDLIVAPYDLKSFASLPADLVDIWQIDPACCTNLPLLREIASVAQRMFLCTWGFYPHEIETALSICAGSDPVLLHSFRDSPRESLIQDMATIKWMRSTGYPVGCYEDSLNVYPICLALAIGIDVVEVPLLDADRPELTDLAAFVAQVRGFEEIIAHGPRLTYSPEELDDIEDVRIALVASRPLPRGTVLTEDMLAVKAPATGLGAELLPFVVGRRILYNLDKDDPITFGVISC